MTSRKSRFPRVGRDSDANQSLTTELLHRDADRPTHGADSPAIGTIEAPIVVVGATGTIGRELVRQLTAAGQPVIAVAPQSGRLDDLRATVAPGTLTPIPARIEDETDAARLADELRRLERPLAGVVVTFPHGRTATIGAGRGRLLEQGTAELCDCLHQTVLAQHALARHLVPLLAGTGRNAHYVIVGGPGSETPWAGYGHRSVAMAATRMLARVLHDEARDVGVRVQLVSIDSPVRGESPSEHECPEWPAAADVARRITSLLDRRNTSESNEAVVACKRVKLAQALGGVARAFEDVPTFIASLKNTNRRITPQ